MSKKLLGKEEAILGCPSSWYAVCFSKELQNEKSLLIKIDNKEFVIFRTKKGVVVAIDAICPHLGANLGHGGKVVGEGIKCPFHGLVFNTRGQCALQNNHCIETKILPVRELNGIIFVYYSNRANFTPTWELPSFEEESWTVPKEYTWPVLNIHPQELLENAVDYLHFTEIHGFSSVKFLETPLIDRHSLTNKMQGSVLDIRFFGLLKNKVEFNTDYTVHGLGLLATQTYIPKFDLKVRALFMPTPISTKQLIFRLHVSINKQSNFFENNLLFRYLPKKWVEALVSQVIFQNTIATGNEDLPIWNHRHYLANPILTDKENAIKIYRDWTKQFYY